MRFCQIQVNANMLQQVQLCNCRRVKGKFYAFVVYGTMLIKIHDYSSRFYGHCNLSTRVSCMTCQLCSLINFILFFLELYVTIVMASLRYLGASVKIKFYTRQSQYCLQKVQNNVPFSCTATKYTFKQICFLMDFDRFRICSHDTIFSSS